MGFLNFLLPTISHIGLFGYWITLLAALLESLAFVGFIFPGTVFIILVGFFSARGFLDLGDLIWFAAIGAILGDAISFYLGKRGTKIFHEESRIFKLTHLKKGEQFFKKYGAKSIFLGRFVGSIRSIVPFSAGLFRMETKKFFFWNILGGFAWAAGFILLGYFFGQAWRAIEIWTTRVGIFLTSILAFFILFYLSKWFILKEGKQIFLFAKSIWASIKQAVKTNPDIQKLVKRHPLFFGFLRSRMDRTKLSGLPLTLMGIVFIYVLFLFLGVLEDVMRPPSILAADKHLASLLALFRSPQLIKIFLWITLLGKWETVITLAAVFSVLFWLWEKRQYIIFLWLSLVGSELFSFIGKIAFHHQRPSTALYLEHSFSFPSGHATIAVALYGFLTYVFLRNAKGWKRRVNIFFAGALVILAIGFSRLYLGVHFFSDVWAGYLLGFLWLIVVIAILEWRYPLRAKTKAFNLSSKAKILALAVFLAGALFYVVFSLHYEPPINVRTPANKVFVENAIKPFESGQLPKYTETLTGLPQEPLNFIILAKDDQYLIRDFQKASWSLAEPVSLLSVAKIAKAAFLNQGYPTAPMTPSFWNDKVNDFGFEKPTQSNTARQRHHARVWRTNLKKDGYNVYAGTGSLDVGIKWLVTHHIQPDIDTEREFLFNNFQKNNLILSARKLQFVKPTLGKNFSGDQFFTDGKIYIITLK